MITGPIYWNGNKFPSQAGNPVAISIDEIRECCGWACDENHAEYPGEINLFTRFPSVTAPSGYYPYPAGMICLGPFDIDIIIRHIQNTYASYDDEFLGSITNLCVYPAYKWGYYGPLDGTTWTVLLANPLPAGSIYSFTVASTIPTQVGIVNLRPDLGNVAKITWDET